MGKVAAPVLRRTIPLKARTNTYIDRGVNEGLEPIRGNCHVFALESDLGVRCLALQSR